MKNQRKKIIETQILGPCQRAKKHVEHEDDGDIGYGNAVGTVGKGSGRTGNRRMN